MDEPWQQGLSEVRRQAYPDAGAVDKAGDPVYAGEVAGITKDLQSDKLLLTYNCKAMSDNKLLRGQQDRTRVIAIEPYVVEDLHQKFPHLSLLTVADAVIQHGPDRIMIV